MIDYIIGEIIEVFDNFIIIDNNGTGIIIETPDKFKKGKTKVYTYLVIKEDTIKLYGFKSREERDVFLKLISINGVGVKHAFSILRELSLEEISSAVQNADIQTFSSVHGIGKKTASRIILELKGKLNFQEENVISDAVEALTSLGFKKEEVINVIKQISKKTKNIEDIIKLSLQKLSEKR